MRSEWTTWRPAYPSCTRATPAHRLSAQDQTLPDVLERRTTRNGGPKPAKRANIPRAVLPQRDPPARTVPRSGSTSQPRDSSTLPTRTGYLPSDLALSLMPQLHDAMKQEPGGESFGTAWIPTGPAPTYGRPGADTAFPELPDSTPKAHRLGPETTTLHRLLPVNALVLDPMHGTTTRKGAEPRRRVSFPRRCSPGTARRGRYPPGFDTDPKIIAQWVSLR